MPHPKRQLRDLAGVGPVMIRNFDRLGITSVAQLAHSDAHDLYERLCAIEGRRIDPCCEDVFCAATAHARDPDLPPHQRQWWYWSRLRKSAEVKR